MTSASHILIIGALAIATGALIWGAVADVRRYVIPNTVSIAVAAAFLLMAVFMPRAFVIGGLLTGGTVLGVGIFVYARGWMGGGDLKLLAATSLWAGPTLLTPFALTMAIGAGVLAIVVMSPLRRLMPAHPVAETQITQGLRQPMPFGVAVAIGGLWLVIHYLSALR